jgi:hypothetical protein
MVAPPPEPLSTVAVYADDDAADAADESYADDSYAEVVPAEEYREELVRVGLVRRTRAALGFAVLVGSLGALTAAALTAGVVALATALGGTPM